MAQAIDTAISKENWTDRYIRFCLTPVDGASIAVFRICLGVLLCWQVVHHWQTGLIADHYIAPVYHFSYLPFVVPPPGGGIYWVFGTLFVAGALMAMGKLPRLASLVAGMTLTYIFLLDKTYYLNHIYLVCLVLFLLALMPAGKTVPRWCVLILRFQFAIVYFFAGIAKIHPDWLAGHPLGEWFEESIHDRMLWPIVRNHTIVILMCYCGMVIDLCAGFLLSFRRTFWLGAALTLPFHFANAVLFEIGIFPWVMIASTGIFAEPDWPRRVWDRAHGLVQRFAKKFPRGHFADAPDLAAQPSTSVFQRCVILGILPLYVLIQLLLPLRHYLYPGETAWTEEGHRFAWRMMLHSKQVREFRIVLQYPGQPAIDLNPVGYATSNQFFNVSTFPDILVQFAHFIADDEQRRTGRRPAIRIYSLVSLNGHRPQYLVDPNVDLAAVKPSFKHADYIMPFRE